MQDINNSDQQQTQPTKTTFSEEQYNQNQQDKVKLVIQNYRNVNGVLLWKKIYFFLPLFIVYFIQYCTLVSTLKLSMISYGFQYVQFSLKTYFETDFTSIAAGFGVGISFYTEYVQLISSNQLFNANLVFIIYFFFIILIWVISLIYATIFVALFPYQDKGGIYVYQILENFILPVFNIFNQLVFFKHVAEQRYGLIIGTQTFVSLTYLLVQYCLNLEQGDQISTFVHETYFFRIAAAIVTCLIHTIISVQQLCYSEYLGVQLLRFFNVPVKQLLGALKQQLKHYKKNFFRFLHIVVILMFSLLDSCQIFAFNFISRQMLDDENTEKMELVQMTNCLLVYFTKMPQYFNIALMIFVIFLFTAQLDEKVLKPKATRVFVIVSIFGLIFNALITVILIFSTYIEFVFVHEALKGKQSFKNQIGICLGVYGLGDLFQRLVSAYCMVSGQWVQIFSFAVVRGLQIVVSAVTYDKENQDLLDLQQALYIGSMLLGFAVLVIIIIMETVDYCKNVSKSDAQKKHELSLEEDLNTLE